VQFVGKLDTFVCLFSTGSLW